MPFYSGGKMNIRYLLISILLLAGLAVAASSKSGHVAGNEAFTRLKTLVGDWEADTSKGKVHSRYELIAGGSVLLEHLSVPGDDEMLTAYHLDGDLLVLTHYCMAGNQPQMAAQRFDPSSGELDFAFTAASNLKPGAGHMHDVNFRLISEDRFDAKWDFVEAGRTKFSEDLHHTRVK
jgi:hypothetical protein